MSPVLMELPDSLLLQTMQLVEHGAAFRMARTSHRLFTLFRKNRKHLWRILSKLEFPSAMHETLATYGGIQRAECSICENNKNLLAVRLWMTESFKQCTTTFNLINNLQRSAEFELSDNGTLLHFMQAPKPNENNKKAACDYNYELEICEGSWPTAVGTLVKFILSKFSVKDVVVRNATDLILDILYEPFQAGVEAVKLHMMSKNLGLTEEGILRFLNRMPDTTQEFEFSADQVSFHFSKAFTEDPVMQRFRRFKLELPSSPKRVTIELADEFILSEALESLVVRTSPVSVRSICAFIEQWKTGVRHITYWKIRVDRDTANATELTRWNELVGDDDEDSIDPSRHEIITSDGTRRLHIRITELFERPKHPDDNALQVEFEEDPCLPRLKFPSELVESLASCGGLHKISLEIQNSDYALERLRIELVARNHRYVNEINEIVFASQFSEESYAFELTNSKSLLFFNQVEAQPISIEDMNVTHWNLVGNIRGDTDWKQAVVTYFRFVVFETNCFASPEGLLVELKNVTDEHLYFLPKALRTGVKSIGFLLEEETGLTEKFILQFLSELPGAMPNFVFTAQNTTFQFSDSFLESSAMQRFNGVEIRPLENGDVGVRLTDDFVLHTHLSRLIVPKAILKIPTVRAIISQWRHGERQIQFWEFQICVDEEASFISVGTELLGEEWKPENFETDSGHTIIFPNFPRSLNIWMYLHRSNSNTADIQLSEMANPLYSA